MRVLDCYSTQYVGQAQAKISRVIIMSYNSKMNQDRNSTSSKVSNLVLRSSKTKAKTKTLM